MISEDQFAESLFEEYKDSREDLWRFLGRLETQLDRSSDIVSHRLASMVISWLVLLGIWGGVLEEGKIGAFALKNVSPVLVLAPLVVALFFYDAMIALAVIAALEETVRIFYQKLTPSISKLDLHILSYPIDFFGAEDLLLLAKPPGRLGKILSGSSPVVVSILFMLSLGILGHASYMAVFSGTTWHISSLVIGISVIVWLRGFLIFVVILTSFPYSHENS